MVSTGWRGGNHVGMDLQPTSAPLPEPYATVRRRHPDVDIVLVPRPRAGAPDGEQGLEVGEAEVAELRARVEEVVHRLERDLGLDDPARRAAVEPGPARGTVIVRSRAAGLEPGDPGVLERLADALEADGWRLQRLPGPVARLVARLDGLRVRASYAPGTGAFLLEVASEPLPVGAERARTLAGS